MKARGAAVQGGLAAVALVAAWATWQREPVRPEGEAVVLQAQRSDVAKVRYDDGARWAELERRGEDTWLRYGARPQVVRAPAGAPDAGVAQTAIPGFEREVRGNELAAQLFEKFAPLRANRSLGALAKEKLAELGLDGTPRRLEVTVRGDKRGYKMSAASALLSAPYLLDEGDGKVYLVSGTLASDFDSASSRLVDRRLHPFAQKDYDAATLEVGGKKRAFVQTGEPPAPLKVAPRAAPDKPDELAQNWLHRIWYLVPSEVLGKGESPQGGAVEVQARVDYEKAGKPLGWVELGRGPQDRLYARTEHTAGWVKAQLGAPEVMADAKKIAGE